MLPTPDKVLHAFIARFDLIVSEGWVTLKETLYGFILALVVGIPMAVAAQTLVVPYNDAAALDAAVAQVQRVRVTLAAVADDGHGLAGQVLEVRVAVVVDLGHF